jgi:hypothetical protein
VPLSNAERQARRRARHRAAIARTITDREARWLLSLLESSRVFSREELAQARTILTRGRDGS